MKLLSLERVKFVFYKKTNKMIQMIVSQENSKVKRISLGQTFKTPRERDIAKTLNSLNQDNFLSVKGSNFKLSVSTGILEFRTPFKLFSY